MPPETVGALPSEVADAPWLLVLERHLGHALINYGFNFQLVPKWLGHFA